MLCLVVHQMCPSISFNQLQSGKLRLQCTTLVCVCVAAKKRYQKACLDKMILIISCKQCCHLFVLQDGFTLAQSYCHWFAGCCEICHLKIHLMNVQVIKKPPCGQKHNHCWNGEIKYQQALVICLSNFLQMVKIHLFCPLAFSKEGHMYK